MINISILYLICLLQTAGREVVVTTPERVYQARDLAIVEVNGEPIVQFTDLAGKAVTLKCKDIADMSFAPTSQAERNAPTDVRVALWTGDTICGSLLKPAKDSGDVLVNSPAMGETAIKLDRIDSVRFEANHEHWGHRPDKTDADLIVTNTGDERQGAMDSIGADGVVYRSLKLKRDITLKPGNCAAVYMMTPVDPPPAIPKILFAIVQLTDGSSLQGTLKSLAGGKLQFADFYGDTRQIPVGSLAGIYFKNGSVIYLSDLPIAKAEEEANYIRDPAGPHRSDKRYPYKLDQNVNGGRIRIAGQDYRKGIGVHSKSELTFDLGGQFQKFEAAIGIDDCARESSPPRGNVVFQVLADGKKVFDSGILNWKDKAKPVAIQVQGVKELKLVVDWGEEYDIGDCADWAAARVIR